MVRSVGTRACATPRTIRRARPFDAGGRGFSSRHIVMDPPGRYRRATYAFSPPCEGGAPGGVTRAPERSLGGEPGRLVGPCPPPLPLLRKGGRGIARRRCHALGRYKD